MNSPARVGAVVLAAGASSRMGSPKPLLPIAGSTYLDHLLGKLRQVAADPVVVVLGCKAEEVRARTHAEGAVVVDNASWREGMLCSIQAALARLRPISGVGAMMLLPVDQPRVAAATMAEVIATWTATRAPVTVPTYEGRRGHPVIFDRAAWSDLLTAPTDEGARSVVRAYGDAVACVAVDDPWILVDADTPADHDTMQRGAGGD